jgi:hypothetical protein
MVKLDLQDAWFPEQKGSMSLKCILVAFSILQSVSAVVIDFNNVPDGPISSLNSELVSIRASESLHLNPFFGYPPGSGYPLSPSDTVAVQPGEIFGSKLTVGTVTPLDPSIYAGLDDYPWWVTQIDVDFKSAVSSLSFDAFSDFFSGNLVYSGLDQFGNEFTGYYNIPPGLPDSPDSSIHIDAPFGGSLNRFYFYNIDRGPIWMTMDNLQFELVKKTPSNPPADVPDSTGLGIFCGSCLVLLLFKKLKAL